MVVRKKKIEKKQRNAREENLDVILEWHVKKEKDSRLLMTALIATVTFTAGITMPARYINEKGPKFRPGVPQF